MPPYFRIDYENRPSEQTIADLQVIRDFFSPPRTLKVDRARRPYKNAGKAAAVEKLRARRLAQYKMRCQDWADYYNSDPSADGIVHHCWVGAPCGCLSPEHTRKRMARLVVQHALARRCPEPQLKEWTKVSSCLRWLLFPELHAGLLMRLFRAATGDVKATRDDPVPAHHVHSEARATPSESPVHAFFRQMEWREMVGAKVKLVNLELGNVHSLFRLTTLGFVVTAAERITCLLQERSANSSASSDNRTPILFDVCNASFSPYTPLLQFLGALLNDGHAATHVLWRSLHCSGFCDCMARFDNEIALARRTIVACIV